MEILEVSAVERESFFDYELPESFIAQRPVSDSVDERANSRLLIAKQGGASWSIDIVDEVFSSIGNYLHSGDLLVLNNTSVRPSRFFGRILPEDKSVEILLIAPILEKGSDYWRALARPMKKLQAGGHVELSPVLNAEVLERTTCGRFVELRLSRTPAAETGRSISELVEHSALMPIPPYIRQGIADERDQISYQTVYAKNRGSIAAPTAGLHFTPALLTSLKERGIQVETITLHVGVGSFLPVADTESHKMASETFEVDAAVLEKIRATKARGDRVVAVGTTCVRALESAVRGTSTETELFITPGFRFLAVDAMVTNFHQPRTTHLLLVSAFIGSSESKMIYEHALSAKYRFLSYGDAMLLIPKRDSGEDLA